ncbi:hypothetical protein DL96DRAFT_220632 [Flagelloscypha sp. PMI_526]|nr:hypothetical protein DL96DRAFT_220632 [Flagelloscypha sp. PMI_526]
MSGLEVLGAIGSAVSIIDGIVAAKSYLSDLRHSTKEREQIKTELQRINGLLVTLQSVISSMPHDNSQESVSEAFNDFKLSVERTQSLVRESSHRVLWTADKSRIKEMQNRYERLGAILNVSFAGYNTQLTMNLHTSSMKEFNHINKNLQGLDMVKVLVEISHLHAIQNWLTSNYLLEDEMSELRKARKPHSGKWLLESEIFQNWLAGTEKVVVLKGPPGCGKTILSSIIADHLETSDSHCFPILIQHTSNMTQKTILCRILSFALSHSAPGLSAEVPSALLTLYKRRKLEEADIQQITSAYLRSMNGPLYIVLDALDELSATPRNDLIALLVDLSPQVRLFVTTRPLVVDYPHASYSLTSSDLYDLKAFVYSEIESLDYAVYGEPEDVSALKDLIMAKSSEMYVRVYPGYNLQ